MRKCLVKAYKELSKFKVFIFCKSQVRFVVRNNIYINCRTIMKKILIKKNQINLKLNVLKCELGFKGTLKEHVATKYSVKDM